MNSFFLDRWIWSHIKFEAARDDSLGRLLGIRKGQPFSRGVLEQYQGYKLRQTISYVKEKSPFYRNLFVPDVPHPSFLKIPADLRHFPFTDPRDIVESPYRFLCVPMGDISRIVSLATSGTTGEKKRISFTKSDIERIIDLLAADSQIVLGRKKGVVQIMLPGGTVLGQADALARGVARAGGKPVISGIALNPEEQIDIIAKQKSATLVGYTSYLHRLTKLAGNRSALRELGVKAIVATGEPIPRAVREELEDAWQARVWCHYGLTEMGFTTGMECRDGSGYHIFEGDYYAEVVDPCTGCEVPESEEGELVLTTLRREGMPLIRYRTGDITRIIGGKCPCGSILKKIDMVAKRKGAGIDLATGPLYPSSFDEVLFSIPAVLDYRLAVKKEPERTVLTFFIELARGNQISAAAGQEVAKALAGHRLAGNEAPDGKLLMEVVCTPPNDAGTFFPAKRPGVFSDHGGPINEGMH